MTILVNALSQTVSPVIPAVATFVKSVVIKIIDFCKSHLYYIMQWSFVALYGIKEILFDRVRDIRLVKQSVIVTHADRVKQHANSVFLKKDPLLGPVKFNSIHGSLYATAGFVGVGVAMHRQGLIQLGGLLPAFELAGNCLFGLASLVTLIHSIRIYLKASKVPSYAPPHVQESASMLKKSAILGMISSLNYIIATALLIIGNAATFALIFGCIAVATGCMKIFYDFLRFREAR